MASTAEPMGLWAQLKSYNKTFWFANVMEMIERWAYYGVRLSLPLYIVGAAALGGLNFTHIQKAEIFLWWAIIASFLPMFTGGFADRYGYKKTVAVAVGLKIVGYGMMATQKEYWPFFIGCMLLAAGTGLFKPGVQGLIAHSVKGANASVGWGIFYQLVNIGAFVGGVLSPHLREMSWGAIFYFNTALVALNFLPLLMFKEPDIDRPAKHARLADAAKEVGAIFVTSIKDLLFQPRLLTFVLIFSGFWIAFHQLFDLLPNFIDDWVSASTLHPVFLHKGAVAPDTILNLNSFLIMVVMIPVAYFASKFKALPAICVGMLAGIGGMLLAGSTNLGYFVVAGIAIFTLGEMLSSPRTQDYLGGIAPAAKKALYLGYAQVPSGIGWAVGSTLGGHLYENHGDKTNFARHWLETQGGMTAEAAKAIPKEKVMETLAAKMNTSLPEATQALWNMHHPERVWYVFAAIGLVSLVAMILYNHFITKLDRQAEASAVVPQAANSETPAVS